MKFNSTALATCVFISIYPSMVFSKNNQAEEWVDSVQNGFTEQFKNAAPNTVPNFQDGVSYSDDPETIKRESVKDSQTDEAAQLIYSLGRKPDIKSDKWFQDASSITDNPTSVVDLGDTGYTDCDEVTQPGGEYSSEESCTITAIPETRTCSYGPEIEVDSHYLYECKKLRDMTNETCAVGRLIDVTQSHKYNCRVGEDVYSKSCDKKLVVSVENIINKYLPYDYCTYSNTVSFYDSLKDGLPYNYDTYIGNEASHPLTPAPGSETFYEIIKQSNSCSINAYRTVDNSYISQLITGNKVHGCESGDSLGPDGYCYTDGAIEFSDAIPYCPNGGSLSNGSCVTQPSWIEYFSATYSPSRFAQYYPRSQLWTFIFENGAMYSARVPGAPQGYNSPTSIGGGLYAKPGKYVQSGDFFGEPVYWYSIMITNTPNSSSTLPSYKCGDGTSYYSGTTCYSIKPPTEVKITEHWEDSCQ